MISAKCLLHRFGAGPMNCFHKQLQTLQTGDVRYERACTNLIDDICDPQQQPHGNIPALIADVLVKACATYPDDHVLHLDETIVGHCACNHPEGYTAAPPPPVPLRRVVAWTNYVKYHLLSPKNLDGRSQARLLRRAAPPAAGTVNSLPAERLRGYTGRDGRPCWWAFLAVETVQPADGERYMQALALGENEITLAEKDGYAVEIRLDVQDLKQPLYKPSALDGFCPNSHFCPDWSDKPHGLTQPLAPGLEPCPELVSKALAYANLAPNSQVTITVMSYRAS